MNNIKVYILIFLVFILTGCNSTKEPKLEHQKRLEQPQSVLPAILLGAMVGGAIAGNDGAALGSVLVYHALQSDKCKKRERYNLTDRELKMERYYHLAIKSERKGDLYKAERYYYRICALGDKGICEKAKMLRAKRFYDKAKKLEDRQHIIKAVKFYKKSCENGYSKGCKTYQDIVDID